MASRENLRSGARHAVADSCDGQALSAESSEAFDFRAGPESLTPVRKLVPRPEGLAARDAAGRGKNPHARAVEAVREGDTAAPIPTFVVSGAASPQRSCPRACRRC